MRRRQRILAEIERNVPGRDAIVLAERIGAGNPDAVDEGAVLAA